MCTSQDNVEKSEHKNEHISHKMFHLNSAENSVERENLMHYIFTENESNLF